MRDSIIKARIARREPCIITSLHYMDPSLYEMVSTLGFDGIWIDTEHHFHTNEAVGSMIRATRVGDVDVMVRPARFEYAQIARFLEMGATGILYPRCSGAQEAAEVVSAAKFPPEGQRGYDGANPDMPYLSMDVTSYVEKANAQTFIGIQIEGAAALRDAARIAATPGVDFVFFGPADYSIEQGHPGQFDHPCLNDALERVGRAACNAGKAWGCPASSLDRARQLIGMGATIITLSSDIGILRRVLKEHAEGFRSLTQAFGRTTAVVG